MREKRHFTRIPYRAIAELIRENGEQLQGEIGNLCLKGMYVDIEDGKSLSTNEIVGFTIHSKEPADDLDIVGSAVVVWHDRKKGYGIFFASLDLLGLGALKRLIALNYENAERIEKEFNSLIQ
jgi:hypothetical protein